MAVRLPHLLAAQQEAQLVMTMLHAKDDARRRLTSVELCAGAGGQALGLERAGFAHRALVEVDPHACNTLRLNRPRWPVVEGDIATFDGRPYRGIDLLAGGLPCPPFSIAGKQRGQQDERYLFDAALRLVDEMRPRAVVLETVPGIMHPRFAAERRAIVSGFRDLGYRRGARLLRAEDFGVSQRRARVIIVALRPAFAEHFRWPKPMRVEPPSVGEALFELMGAEGWRGAARWRRDAADLAPTIVGGSKKHGGADLGPSGSRAAWRALGVNGSSIADAAPDRSFVGSPRLTIEMVARLQAFPDDWEFAGRKTAAYRQVGNAFPPPLACAVATQVHRALAGAQQTVTWDRSRPVLVEPRPAMARGATAGSRLQKVW